MAQKFLASSLKRPSTKVVILGLCLTACGPAQAPSVPSPTPAPTPSPGPGVNSLPPEIDDGTGGFEFLAIETKRDLVPADTSRNSDVYLVNAKTNELQLLRPPSIVGSIFWGTKPAISAENRYISFSFTEMGDPEIFRSSIWRFDRQTGAMTAASTTLSGQQPLMRFAQGSEESTISGGGLLVVFASWARNLINGEDLDSRNIFLKNLNTGAILRLSRPPMGGSLSNPARLGRDFTAMPRVNSNGTHIVFASNAMNFHPDASDGEWDVFMYLVNTGQTLKISTRADGQDVKAHAWDPDVSEDGNLVVFSSLTNHSQNYDYIPVEGGRAVCPGTAAEPSFQNVHWLCGAFQIYLKHRDSGAIERVSATTSGEPAVCGWTGGARLSASGSHIVFVSSAVNLLNESVQPGFCSPNSSPRQVFVRDPARQTTIQMSMKDGESLKGPCHSPQISADGREIAFQCASALKRSETGPEEESLFIVRRISGAIRRVF